MYNKVKASMDMKNPLRNLFIKPASLNSSFVNCWMTT